MGCDMNLHNEDGNSALYCFLLTDFLPVHDKMAHLLIDAGCDLNAHNEHGNTALHFAAKHDFDYSRIVGRLIEKDADIHLKNKKNEKPLDVAYNQKIRRLFRPKFEGLILSVLPDDWDLQAETVARLIAEFLCG